MNGPIEVLKDFLGLNPPEKKKAKKKKKKKKLPYNHRDYRGVEGVLEDAQRKPKKK